MKTALGRACLIACTGCQAFYGVSASDDGAPADARRGSGADASMGGSADAAAGASGTFIQLGSQITDDPPVTPLTVVLGADVEGGDLIVVAVSTYQTTIAGISDTLAGSAYTPIVTGVATGLGDGNPPSQLSMYYAIAPTTGTYQLSLDLDFSAGNDSGATVAAADYRGAHTLVGKAVDTGTTLNEAANCPLLTAVDQGQLDFAAVVADGSVAITSGAGYTLRAAPEQDDDYDPVLVTEDGAGQTGATFGISRMQGSGGWVCGVAAFE